jgi:vitamin B12 transporter
MPPLKRMFWLLSLMCVFLSQASFASDSESTELSPIIVSANLTEQSVDKVIQSVEVVSAEQIKKSKATTVAEVLKDLVGIDTVSLGSPGDDLEIRLRGTDRDETLVMIDGIPLNSIIDSRANLLNSIPVDFIKQIEIIRGPHSVAYGSSAVGGIINIITRKEGAKEYILSADAGNLGTFKESIGISQNLGKHAFNLSFTRHDQLGRFNHDSFHGNSIFSNYRFTANDEFKIDVGLLYLNQDQDLAYSNATSFANFPTLDIYVVRDLDRVFKRDVILPHATITYNPLSWYEISVGYGLFYEELNLDNSNQGETAPNAAAALDSQVFDSIAHRHHFDFRNSFYLWEESDFSLTATFGMNADLEFLHFTDSPFTGDTTTKTNTTFPDTTTGQKDYRRNIAGYSQLSATIYDRVMAQFGIRFDDNDTYGSAFSPRAALGYVHPSTKSKIFASFSRGFIAPSLNQYYLAVIGGTLSQQLSEETSQTYEIGFEQPWLSMGKQGRVAFNATYFYTDYNAHIQELQLIANSHVHGIEASFKYNPVSWLEIYSNYTFTHAINDDDGSNFSNVPRHLLNSGFTVEPIENLSFNFHARSVSSRLLATTLSTDALGDLGLAFFDGSSNAAGTSLPSYYTLNIAASYKHELKLSWLNELTYSLRVNNILDNAYQERFGYPMPGFNFLAGITARFKEDG